MTDMIAFDSTPFLEAAPFVQFHATAAMIAVLAGPIAIYRKRRDRLHKWVGYTWVGAMGIAALTAFGISSFPVVGPFSPIHLLAVLALVSLWRGVTLARARQFNAHGQALKSLYWRGLLVAAAFNFLPGRVVNRTLFDQAQELGYLPLTAILILIAGQVVLTRTGRTAPRQQQAARRLHRIVEAG